VTYIGPIIALRRIDTPRRPQRLESGAGATRVADGIRYARTQPAVYWSCLIVGVFGFFNMNLPVTLAAYARTQFDSGASGYGLLTSAVALGSLAGALLATRWCRTRLRGLVTVGALACLATIAASLTVDESAFLVLLVAVGATSLMLVTTINSTVQLSSTDDIRGRVMGIYVCVFMGSGALGGPVVGAIDQYLGPRTGLLLAGLLPGTVILLVAIRLARAGGLRLGMRPTGTRGPVIMVVSR
jgi:hypothetical protein